MTEKEKIMIDGVDVTQFNSDELACMNRYDVARLFIGLVEELQRKTAECERYKKTLNKIEKYFKSQDTTRTSLFNIYCIEEEIKNIIKKAKGGNYEH